MPVVVIRHQRSLDTKRRVWHTHRMKDSQNTPKTDHPYDTTATHELRLFPREAYEAYMGTGELFDAEDTWRMRKDASGIDRQLEHLFPPPLRLHIRGVSIYGDVERPSVVVKRDKNQILALAWHVCFLTPGHGLLAWLLSLLHLMDTQDLVILDCSGHVFQIEDLWSLLDLLSTSQGMTEAIEYFRRSNPSMKLSPDLRHAS